ncbi:hypothetical protein SUDANB54_00533 [Streptomyces sp. enrichment culture]
MRERWPMMCGCMVSWNRPPSAYAWSNSSFQMDSTPRGGVYGLREPKRSIMKYGASSRIHSTGISTTPVGSPPASSS